MIDYKALIQAAFSARLNAYAPYSSFQVGAALLGKNGKVYLGCNVENAAFAPTNCAERTAVFSAVCDGEQEFIAIAIVGGKEKTKNFADCFPCGVCRQVLQEFCHPDFSIIVAKSDDDYQIYSLAELLPHGFGKTDLN